jgi:hypothetical protein
VAPVHKSKWLTLAESVQRAVARGIDGDEAKATICEALAARKIEIRGWLERADESPASIQDIDVPRVLEPGDFNWEESRPHGRQGFWYFRQYHDLPGQNSYSPHVLIKLSAADIDVLFSSKSPRPKTGPKPNKLKDAEDALRAGLSSGKIKPGMPEKVLLKHCPGISRSTFRRARRIVQI